MAPVSPVDLVEPAAVFLDRGRVAREGAVDRLSRPKPGEQGREYALGGQRIE